MTAPAKPHTHHVRTTEIRRETGLRVVDEVMRLPCAYAEGDCPQITLLEAAKKMLWMLQSATEIHTDMGMPKELREELQRAIEKAEGK